MPRTTVNIDDPILNDIRELQRREGKSLGDLISELLAEALTHRAQGRPAAAKPFRWASQPMQALIDIRDKDALYRALDKR